MELNSNTPHPWAWAVILAGAAIVGSLASACLMPFAALATLAAATLPQRRAMVVVLAGWAFNQAAGFGVLGYPHTAQAALQGLTLGLAALGATAVAALTRGHGLLRLGLSFMAAFATYELALWAGAHATGGLATFAPRYVLLVAQSEMLWFALLTALSALLQRSAPAVAPPHPLTLRVV